MSKNKEQIIVRLTALEIYNIAQVIGLPMGELDDDFDPDAEIDLIYSESDPMKVYDDCKDAELENDNFELYKLTAILDGADSGEVYPIGKPLGVDANDRI